MPSSCSPRDQALGPPLRTGQEPFPSAGEPAHRDVVALPALLSGLDRFHGHSISTQLAFDDDVCAREFVNRNLVSLEGIDLISSRSRCLILTLLLCSPDHGYPWILDQCSRWVSREEIGRFTGPKPTADRV